MISACRSASWPPTAEPASAWCWRGGDLPLAIRASMSVPAVFAPVDPHRQSLIDGGISDNVPINVARFGYDHALGHDDRGTVLAGLRGLTEQGSGRVLQVSGVLGGFLVRRVPRSASLTANVAALPTPRILCERACRRGSVRFAAFDRQMTCAAAVVRQDRSPLARSVCCEPSDGCGCRCWRCCAFPWRWRRSARWPGRCRCRRGRRGSTSVGR
ncbi:MAG: patatin-like phospholipase family protein [Metallibacterium sp.]